MNNKKTLLILAYYYPPDSSSGVYRILYLANHLVKRGNWNILIVTPDEKHYLQEQSTDPKLLDEIDDRIKIYRTKAYNFREKLIGLKKIKKDKPKISESKISTKNNKKSCLQKLKDFITDDILAFPDKQGGWIYFALKEVKSIQKKNKIDLILSTGSPWSSHVTAFLSYKFYKIPYVLDYRDPWNLNPYNSEHTRLFKSLSILLEKKINEHARNVICNTPTLEKQYKSFFCDAGKYISIPNGYEREAITNASIEIKRKNELVMVHAGHLYGQRNPETLISVVTKLNKTMKYKLIVYLIGVSQDLVNKLNHQFKDSVAEGNIILLPRIPNSEVMNYLKDADLLLIFQQGTAVQVPRKLYEYIGLGKPILAVCENEDIDIILTQSGLGLSVPDDQVEIKKTLVKIMENLHSIKPDVEYIQQYYNGNIAIKLEQLLDRVLTLN